MKGIVKLIEEDEWMMDILRLVKTLDLPDWYVGAGFIRSKVWDVLHEYNVRTPIPDIDVIYLNKIDFDADEASKESTKMENIYEEKFRLNKPELNWSVTNQARMHIFHNDEPYCSSEEALSRWVETATCVAVKIDEKNNLVLSSPRGVDDLVNLVVRPINRSKKTIELFNKRVKDKKWLEKWPKLKIDPYKKKY